MALKKYPLDHTIVDGENVAVRLDHAYAVSAMGIDEAISELLARHGDNIGLIPLSGMSGGAGVFQVDSNRAIVGLHIQPCWEPVVKIQNQVDVRQVKLDEILIDQQHKWIYAGSAVNLNQLNQALAGELGPRYRVLGADLTSYTYAQVGASFMTGGMGPQRRYFSDSVRQVILHNGETLELIEGDRLNHYAGTYGWTGIVTAICCHFVELPENEVAFALPVNNSPEDLARLLAHFAPLTQLTVSADSVVTSHAGGNLIMGLEHITSDAMQPFLNGGDHALINRVVQLKANCEGAGADGLVFVNGFSNLDTGEFLFTLVDDGRTEVDTIAGIKLEYAEIFKDPEQMRAVREGIPYAARMQAPEGAYCFKGHTDTNVRLNPESVEQSMRLLWQLNQQYVNSVQSYFDQNEPLRGEILVYGHLNPVGVDPHNRITFACDDESIYNRAVQFLDELKGQYMCQLAALCGDTGSDFIGGEKGAGSDYEVLPLFGDLIDTPPQLAEKVARQRDAIRAASPLFNWRAMKPYQ